MLKRISSKRVVQTTTAAHQQHTQSLDRALLQRYTEVISFRLEFEKVVHKHELTDHMDFNDDQVYKGLMNEVCQRRH